MLINQKLLFSPANSQTYHKQTEASQKHFSPVSDLYIQGGVYCCLLKTVSCYLIHKSKFDLKDKAQIQLVNQFQELVP